MFDLITGQTRHIPSKPAVPILISVSSQLALVTAVVLPVLFFTGAMPEVPTMIEQGYKEFVMGNWTGIVAPAKTPKPVVNKLATEITRIIRSPEVSKRLLDMGVDPLGGTPEEFGKLIRFEIERFGKAVKASGARVD